MSSISDTPIFDELNTRYIEKTPKLPVKTTDTLATVALTDPKERLEDANTEKKPQLEVSKFLSPSAKEILDNINQAIVEGHSNVSGLPFSMYIDSGYYDKGVITVYEHRILMRAFETYEHQSRRLT